MNWLAWVTKHVHDGSSDCRIDITVESIASGSTMRYPPTMPSGTRRENPVAIAHLHTTLNKSRDEKLIVAAKGCLSPIDRDRHLKISKSSSSGI